MGVQDRDRAGCALKLGITLAELLQCLPTAAQQLFVDELLMRKCQWAQLGWQGEGEQKVLRWHLLLQLPIQPLLGLVMLAMWA